MKRYYLRYDSDQIVCGSNEHTYGFANSLKTAKNYISRCRREKAEYNPRNVRIYDIHDAVDPKTGHIPYVYRVE